ncbi:MAG: carboxypeptidase-like regulatory domain-containing protein [Bryobacteraceae bacterium]
MKKHWIALIALAILASVPRPVLGQAGYGSIGGSILDPAGAVVPNAKVTVTNTATNIASHSASLGDGRYLAAQLPPGMYQISVEVPGFKKYVSSGIVVQVDDKLAINIKLEIGSPTETVTVTGEAPPMRTEDAETGEVVNNDFIMNLPEIDRNPFDLIRISGNVQGSEGGVSASTHINGGRTSSIDFFIDGNVVTSGRGHTISDQTPSMDAVQEFKVVTNGISAEYGRISGGYVELVTKSGTNGYHGDMYEYMFNDMFDANSWYQNAVGNPKVHFRQNDYGFTLGGPVSIPKIYNGKNRTFFFVDNEYYRYNQAGNVVLMTVPNQDQRNGNFENTVAGGYSTMMYDPNGEYATTPNPDGNYSRLTLLGGDGKTVPAAQIDPTTAAILADLPLPNRPSTGGFTSGNNYQGYQNTLNNTFRFGTRLDEMITDNQRLFIHYITYNQSGGQSRVGGPLFTANTTRVAGALNGSVNYDWTATPTLLFNVRASVIHDPNDAGSTLPASFNAASLHLNPEIQAILGSSSIPTIQEDFGMCCGYYGDSPSETIAIPTTYDFGVTGTKILNRHTLKFGMESRRYYDNFLNKGGYNPFTFDGNPVASESGDHGFSSAQSVPNSLGAMELGLDDWATIQGYSTRAMNVNYNAVFVQDDFKVNSKLTVNVGLRWDREGPTTERHDKIYFWDQNAPSLFTINSGYTWAGALAAAGLPASTPAPSWVNGMPTGAVELPNTPDFPSRDFQNVDSHQFAPRLGLAYQLDKKTVLRASGGLMYLPTTGDAGGFSSSNESLPLSAAANAGWHASTDGLKHYISSWANPFPLPGMITEYSRDTLLTNQESGNPPGVTAYSQDMHMPREYTWGISIQRELPVGWVLEAGWSGNRGLGLLAPNNISMYPANLFNSSYASTMTTSMASPNAGQTLSTSTVGPTMLAGILEYPYPQYGTVTVLGTNAGSSTFNALNLRLEHRMSHGLTFLLNYTYSHALDDVGGPEASSGSGQDAEGINGKRNQSIYPFQSTWGLSADDQPNRLVLTFLYQLPVGKGRQWLGSPQTSGQKVLDRIAGGWQLAGNYTYVSGTPVQWWGTTTINTNNTILVETTYGSYATSNHNLGNPAYTGDSGSLIGPSQNPSTGISRFNAANMVTAQNFVAGNLPFDDPSLRNPSFYQMDLSLMKNFYILSEKRYLQVRAEAQNAFNIRGFGPYNNDLGTSLFGLITAAGNSPRAIQLSARFVF